MCENSEAKWIHQKFSRNFHEVINGILDSLNGFVLFSPNQEWTTPLLSPTSPEHPLPPPSYHHTYQDDQDWSKHYTNPRSNYLPSRNIQSGLDQISYEFDSTGEFTHTTDRAFNSFSMRQCIFMCFMCLC